MATEVDSGWDIYALAVSSDPHSAWRKIREQTPVLDLGDGVFFVSSWEWVDRVLRDSRFGAGAGVSASFGASEGLAFEAMRVWLMSLDGPPHDRARGLVRREFTPRRIESMREKIEGLADQLVGSIEVNAVGSEVDLIEALAFPLPSEVIRSLFGIEPEPWRVSVEAVLHAYDDAPDAGIRMIESLASDFDAMLSRADVPPGLLEQLQVADDEWGRLSPLEIVANAVLLVTAAVDTTAGLIGNAAACLLDRPDVLAEIRRDPTLVPMAIEETLRFEPPALSCSRSAFEDVEIDGIRVPKGSQVLLGLAAANRDPSRYAEPDTFRLDRDFSQLVSFGGGRHFCLGATLARMEARIAIERLLIQSSVELSPVEEPVWQTRNPTVRALERLRVRIDARQEGTGGDPDPDAAGRERVDNARG